jgi:hypothetical protein
MMARSGRFLTHPRPFIRLTMGTVGTATLTATVQPIQPCRITRTIPSTARLITDPTTAAAFSLARSTTRASITIIPTRTIVIAVPIIITAITVIHPGETATTVGAAMIVLSPGAAAVMGDMVAAMAIQADWLVRRTWVAPISPPIAA